MIMFLLPNQKIKVAFKNYINGALKWSEVYKVMMTSSDPKVLNVTGIIAKRFSQESKELAILKKTIEEGMDDKIFVKGNALLIAQSVWASVFGLVMKMIVEKDFLGDEKDKLMECQLKIIIRGISN